VPSRADSISTDRSSAYTIPLLCAGIAIIACCLLIPAADDNHRLVYEREKLRRDLDQIQKQVSVNDDLLRALSSDPARDPSLMERFAERQMRLVPQGASVLKLQHATAPEDLSPFLLVNLPPPPALAPYHELGGVFADLCRHPRSRLFIMGAGMFLVGASLVMGAGPVPGSSD
jgi:hypothetical protein